MSVAEPVSIELARAQLRIGASADDDLLVGQAITAAREWIERETGHLLVRRKVVEAFVPRCGAIDLRAWPDVTIEAVEYRDAAGSIVVPTSAYYIVSPFVRPTRLALVSSSGWRAFSSPGVPSSPIVTVTMQAGYALGTVPARFVRAMLILVTAFYEARGEDGIPPAAEASARALIRFDRLRRV